MITDLNIGDLLYRSKGIVQHTGVYLGTDQVLHNTPSTGVRISHFRDFAENKVVKVVKVTVNDHTLLTQRLQEILCDNNHYHVFGNNCEHIAYQLIHGRKESSQKQIAIMGALFGFWLGNQLENKPVIRTTALCSLIGLVLCNSLRQYDHYIPHNPTIARQ